MSANASLAEQAVSEEGLLSFIAGDLDLLARLHDRELDRSEIAELRTARPQDWFALPPSDKEAIAGFELLQEAFRVFDELPEKDWLDELAADFAGLHLTHAYRASPNESVWTTEDGLERQEPMFAVRNWYRQYSLEVADWRIRSDDHIVNQIAFVAQLLRLGKPEAYADAGRFLDEHLLNWVGEFTCKAAVNCQTPFYSGVCLITRAYLLMLRETLEAVVGQLRKPKKKVIALSVSRDQEPNPSYIPGIQESW